jgi:hypothetical protein
LGELGLTGPACFDAPSPTTDDTLDEHETALSVFTSGVVVIPIQGVAQQLAGCALEHL